MNPRNSGDDRKAGTRFAACDQPLLAIFRSDANGCSVALCQRRQPPKAGAVGQRLQRVTGQPSLTIKSDGWFPIAAGPTDPRADPCQDDLDSGTDSAPFMRGFSPPPTDPEGTGGAAQGGAADRPTAPGAHRGCPGPGQRTAEGRHRARIGDERPRTRSPIPPRRAILKPRLSPPTTLRAIL